MSASSSSDGESWNTSDHYSLRVRLLSAVDLPPSLSPNVPLCPWFELGLVKGDQNEDDDDANLNVGGKRELMPKWSEEGGDEEEKEQDMGNAESEASQLLKRLPPSAVRTSAFKIMTKATNGGGGNGADWSEEYRWDSISNPMDSILAVKLCTRLAPDTDYSPSAPGGIGSPSADEGGIKGLWRKGRLQMEEHRRRSIMSTHSGSREEKAAAVAQFLMNDESSSVSSGRGGIGQNDLVDYQAKWREKREGMAGSSENVESSMMRARGEENRSEGLCLGTLLIPLRRLPLEDAYGTDSAAVVERWYQLDGPNLTPVGEDEDEDGKGLLHGPRRCPSVLLELTFASPEYLDRAEEEILGGEQNTGVLDLSSMHEEEEKADVAVAKVEEEPKNKEDSKKKDDKPKPDEPELDMGVVDFVCVVGARDIGNQRNDDGSKGWVQSTPECCVLERFPPDDEFHVKNGRNTGLIPQAEWFCFPEGCKLWRGASPPTHDDLKAGGVSTAAQSSDVPSSFDSCLGSAASFSWFVLSSNSDDYGSKLVKTYGVVVRFYVPAPKGIDPTQDDFAQTMTGGGGAVQKGKSSDGHKRLWVPIGICLSTTLPIVGVMEEILRRMCDAMATRISSGDSSNLLSYNGKPSTSSKLYDMLQKDIFHLVVNFPKPIPGVVHCSIPFLEGERLHVTTAPPNGLPSLPHGGAIASACRLLGAEGLTLLLAAALTECKILIHSVNVANVAMVAEVISALIFPFTWQLPFIPVLPKDMLEFLEAPLSFFVGIPTINLQHCDRNVLSEIVVVDLDDIAGSTDYEGRRGPRTKIPSALPASVSSSISKAVFRLLREEDEIDAQMNAATFPGCRRSARLENESMAERKFRIHVAIQICSLIRGYQECLFFVSASQPVFNRDRFLRQAPALFEDKRPSVLIDTNYSDKTSRILSPRSKRFLSVLVNSQHFHQLLERLSSEETSFFHEVMESIEPEDDSGAGVKSYFATNFGSPSCDEVANKLYESLEQIERKIPTYRVDRKPRPPGIIRWQEEDDEEFKMSYDVNVALNDSFWFEEEEKPSISFTFSILKPIMDQNANSESSSGGVHALSLEYLVELEKNPWRYSNMLEIPVRPNDESGETKEDGPAVEYLEIRKKTKLRDAIGERRFRAWKIANDHKDDEDILSTPLAEKSTIDKTFDLSTILSNVPDLPLEPSATSTQPHVDANDRDKVRRCLEIAFGSSQNAASFQENGRDLIADAEAALRNPSAQRYLFSVLSQRNKIEKQRSKRDQQSVSRLEQGAFECIVRLCIAVLEACQEEEDYESAYRLLGFTGGFCTVPNPSNQADHKTTLYMTERIKVHSIFLDLRLWERVLLLHQKEQQNDQNNRKDDDAGEEKDSDSEDGEEKLHPPGPDAADVEDTADSDSYDAAVSTLYEMVGYGVPAEELSRFATRISEEKGWFSTDKGQSLLVLARRLTAKRDDDGEKTGEAVDFNIGKSHIFDRQNSRDIVGELAAMQEEDNALTSVDISWAHPSTSLSRQSGAGALLKNILGGAAETQMSNQGYSKSLSGDVLNAGGYTGRVAITAMASFGTAAVVTGGVDGSVFLAHTIHFGSDMSEFESNCSARPSCPSLMHSKPRLINGVKLQWGSQGEDGDCVTGAVSCLAASKGSAYRTGGSPSNLDSIGCADEDEIIASTEGCQIIGGTTCGGLRVWSLKDIYQASLMSRMDGTDNSSVGNRSHQGSGVNSITSTLVRHNDDHGLQDAIKGSSIGGHRGGVTCVDVPPRMYRPDALLSGGEDGLIKLWSLKSSSSSQDGRSHSPQNTSIQSRFFANRQVGPTIPTDYDASDTQGVFTGHEGRIICIKTAWHGDKLLSGGADKTIRLWDLSGATKPLATLRGHQGWVTETHFWGQIIVSASTDRSIALWDTRAGSSPLFNLRYHLSPVSDLLLGNRSESLMVSAGADGSLATWDFRVISGSAQEATSVVPDGEGRSSRTIRTAVATMDHLNPFKRTTNCGIVRLCRAVGRHEFCFLSVSDDGIVNEWDASTGRKMSTHKTGHCDAISGFSTFSSKDGLRQSKHSNVGESSGGSITCSWDGTVRLRRLSRRK